MLFEKILPSINNKTGNVFEKGDIEDKDYVAFVVNKALSFDANSILFVNEMNKYHFLPNKMQYDFYYYGLPQAKRFNKWIKEEKNPDIDIVAQYYKCSKTKAKEYLNILNDEQIKTIRKRIHHE